MFGPSTSPIVFVFVLLAVAGYYGVLIFGDPGASRHMATRSLAALSTEDESLEEGTATTPANVPVVSALDANSRLLPPEKISGEAKVSDDGSLEIVGTRIHLNGVVLRQKGGEGLQALRSYAKTGDLYCSLLTDEVGDIRSANCWTMNGGHPIDIVAELILSGVARECVKESGGRYIAFEQMSAKDIKLPPECSDGDDSVVSSTAQRN